MSTGMISSNRSAALPGTGAGTWRLPDRLQIVKPMEGSQTLHHWAQLATPTMSGEFRKANCFVYGFICNLI